MSLFSRSILALKIMGMQINQSLISQSIYQSIHNSFNRVHIFVKRTQKKIKQNYEL